MTLEVRRYQDEYAVFRGNERLTKALDWTQARAARGRFIKLEQVAASGTERACLCCATVFLSAGTHNRLCQTCRHGDSDLQMVG